MQNEINKLRRLENDLGRIERDLLNAQNNFPSPITRKNMGIKQRLVEIRGFIDSIWDGENAKYYQEKMDRIDFEDILFKFQNDSEHLYLQKNIIEWRRALGKICQEVVQQMIKKVKGEIKNKRNLEEKKELDLEKKAVNLPSDFWDLMHPKVIEIAKRRFISKHFADAVEATMKHINSKVKKAYSDIKGIEKDGAKLMFAAFGKNKDKNKKELPPVIDLRKDNSSSENNIQEGYTHLFAGAMRAIRNPKAHDNISITPKKCIQFLVFASLLMEKLDEENYQKPAPNPRLKLKKQSVLNKDITTLQTAISTLSRNSPEEVFLELTKDTFVWGVGPELEIDDLLMIYIPKTAKNGPKEEKGSIPHICQVIEMPQENTTEYWNYDLKVKKLITLSKPVTRQQVIAEEVKHIWTTVNAWRGFSDAGKRKKPLTSEEKNLLWSLIESNNPGTQQEIRKQMGFHG